MLVETRVEQVTIHRNGALIVRRGAAPAGRVEVAGLPLLFSSDSLRVRVEGGRVQDLEEVCRIDRAPDAPTLAGGDEIERLSFEIARLEDDARTAASLAQALEGFAPSVPKERDAAVEPPDAAAWIDLLRFAHERIGEIDRLRAQAALAREEAAKRKATLQRLAVDARPPRVARGLRFTIDGAGDAGAPISIEYFVAAARWVPTYELFLTTEADAPRARLVMQALVAQATGEDWSAASLSFSTADLSRESTLPELSSWRIGRAQPSTRRAYRPLPADLPSLFIGYDAFVRRPTSGAVMPAEPAPEMPSAPPAPPPKAMPARRPMQSGEGALARGGKGGRRPRDEVHTLSDDDDDDAGDGSAADDFESARTAEADAMMQATPTSELEELSMSRARADVQSLSARFAPAPGAPPMMQAKRSGVLGGAFGGGGGGGVEAAVMRAPQKLPPRLRHAYLRLMGPDERDRGDLVALDPMAHLRWLVEDHGANATAELARAVAALAEAAQRLRQTPTPPGTSPLDVVHFHHRYAARGRHAVPSDASWHKVSVDAFLSAYALEWRAVPRVSLEAYRTAILQAPPGVPLPDGPLAVYDDGSFRVNARLEGSGGGKALELNLGVDPDVRVLSRVALVHQEEKGLVSSTSRIRHDVKVQVRSTRTQPARVVLYDRVPVPADNVTDVEVTMLEAAPQPQRTDVDAFGKELPGGLRFTLELAPGQTVVVAHAYEVKLPAKAELEGGNRRE